MVPPAGILLGGVKTMETTPEVPRRIVPTLSFASANVRDVPMVTSPPSACDALAVEAKSRLVETVIPLLFKARGGPVVNMPALRESVAALAVTAPPAALVTTVMVPAAAVLVTATLCMVTPLHAVAQVILLPTGRAVATSRLAK